MTLPSRSQQTRKPVILSEASALFAMAKSKDPYAAYPATTSHTFLTRAATVAALSFALSIPLHAQGCAQCLDTTRSTPPSVQAAYRHAILLLGGFATTLFIAGGILLARRQS